MITRLYVDNYKGLNDFTLEPQQLTLLLGENGSGKSTVFEVLDALRRLLCEQRRAVECFRPHTLSKSVSPGSVFQHVELNVTVGAQQYEYALRVGHSANRDDVFVFNETLKCDGTELLRVAYDSDEQLSSVWHEGVQIGQIVSLGWASASALAVLGERNIPSAHPFLDFVDSITLIRINPSDWSPEAERDGPRVAPDGSNFAAFHSYLWMEQREVFRTAIADLGDFGFTAVQSKRVGEQRRKTYITQTGIDGKPFDCGLDELSDGQRAILLLYTLTALMASKPICLLIDEPDNYLSPREIQPWFSLLEERTFEKGSQTIIASHHPDAVNRLGRSNGILLDSDDAGKPRARPVKQASHSELSPYDLLARGWFD